MAFDSCLAADAGIHLQSAEDDQQVLNKVAATNLALERAVTVAHQDGIMTDDQERQWLGWSKKIAQTGNSASAAFLAGDNVTTLAQINLAIGVIDDAINNGLVGIKNENTKTALSASLLLLRGFFTTAQGFIPGGA